jgi:hypothetical protein
MAEAYFGEHLGLAGINVAALTVTSLSDTLVGSALGFSTLDDGWVAQGQSESVVSAVPKPPHRRSRSLAL